MMSVGYVLLNWKLGTRGVPFWGLPAPQYMGVRDRRQGTGRRVYWGNEDTLTLSIVPGMVDVRAVPFRSNGTTYHAGESSSAVCVGFNGNGRGESPLRAPPTAVCDGLVTWSNSAAGARLTIPKSR